MKPNLLMTIILPQIFSCQSVNDKTKIVSVLSDTTLSYIHNRAHTQTVAAISTPSGYKRRNVSEESFSAWLRTIPLKKDNRVFLYNGALKQNQSAQFAVLDIPVGKKDLQQCADAVM